MFDLEAALKAWRNNLSAKGLANGSTLDELESHLRDEVEAQVLTGLSTEAAFRLAIARLGEAPVLQQEFSKLSTDKAPALATILRIACLVAAPVMFLEGAWSLWQASLNPSLLIPGLIALCMVTAYIAALPFIYRQLPNPERPAVGALVTFLSLSFGALPIVALLDALKIWQTHASYTVVIICSYLYVLAPFTGFAYACRTSYLHNTPTALAW